MDEFSLERVGGGRTVGNIYKGIVVRVDSALDAAFVDFGPSKHGFLQAGDVMDAYGECVRAEAVFAPEHAQDRRARRPVESLLRSGQEVVVQVTRDAMEKKGATLTTYVSLPGRFLVMMPGASHGGVSRRITSEADRDALRAALQSLTPPEGVGFIVRTAGLGRDAGALRADFEYLTRAWERILDRVRIAKPPALLYEEQDLVIRAVRDMFREGIGEIVVDTDEARERAAAFLGQVGVPSEGIVRMYSGPAPLLTHYGLEEEVARLSAPRVPLPSGGSLVIQQTEALVAIDVNSGKSRGARDVDAMILQTNLEAAREVARQLRLRDLGGEIVVDFIDMEVEDHVAQVEACLRDALAPDRARMRVGRISSFGLLEMTRQRMRPGVSGSSLERCAACEGIGRVPTVQTVALGIWRRLRRRLAGTARGAAVVVRAHPGVVAYLRENRGPAITAARAQAGVEIRLEASSEGGHGAFSIE